MITSFFLPALSSFASHKRRTLKRPHLDSQRGFTMIELVVVIGMTGVLLAASQVDFSKMIAQFNLDSATRTTVSILNDARVKAITEGEARIVSFDSSTKKFTVKDAANTVVAEKELPAGVNLLSLFGDVTFTSLGTLPVQNSWAYYSVSSSAGARGLLILRTGKVNIL